MLRLRSASPGPQFSTPLPNLAAPTHASPAATVEEEEEDNHTVGTKASHYSIREQVDSSVAAAIPLPWLYDAGQIYHRHLQSQPLLPTKPNIDGATVEIRLRGRWVQPSPPQGSVAAVAGFAPIRIDGLKTVVASSTGIDHHRPLFV
ncbi:unnamed protein product [Cuscuta campestris]|uniref:Uncharacterized protein n=1 Tax=Cuscuta campestris TaxID=132261 RepID=A0A484N2N6_9ASTE|nr:unnamed protein product [Cuscuta campestris]